MKARTRVAATSRFTTVTQNSGRLPSYFAAYWSRKSCPIGLPSSYWSIPTQPMNAFHMIGLTHAFWNAVVVNRGGSQPRASSAGLMKTMPKPKPRCTIASAFASCRVCTAALMSCAVCAIADLRDDPNTLAATRTSQVLQVALADEALLDQHADLGESALGDQVGQEDRLVGHRPLRERERPLAQPVVGAGHADRGHLEAFLDGLAQRHAVVGDVRTEHHQAALVDEFAVGVDHRLDRTLGQALDLAVDHLHRPVHQALLDGLFEDEVEGLGEGGEQVLRETRAAT